MSEDEMIEQAHLAWLQAKLEAYHKAVSADGGLKPYTQVTYMSQASKFVRWVTANH